MTSEVGSQAKYLAARQFFLAMTLDTGPTWPWSIELSGTNVQYPSDQRALQSTSFRYERASEARFLAARQFLLAMTLDTGPVRPWSIELSGPKVWYP